MVAAGTEETDGRTADRPVGRGASYQRRKVRVKWNTRDKQVVAARTQAEVLSRASSPAKIPKRGPIGSGFAGPRGVGGWRGVG